MELAFNESGTPVMFDVQEDSWAAVLKCLSDEPFQGEVLKWHSLADVRLECTSGKAAVLRVYLTNQDKGCYESNGSYYVCDEGSLRIAVRGLIEKRN